MNLGQAHIIQGNALNLPLPDASVDLICTSPPYFGLRSYQDGCGDCGGEGRAKRPDSHGHKICPNCGNVENRKRCSRCDTSMKWPPRAEQYTDGACLTCNGTGKGHYDGQLGSEATPAGFLEALLAATREMVRVLKPSGSIFVNLGDKYASQGGHSRSGASSVIANGDRRAAINRGTERNTSDVPLKSLMGIPWRYALACIDQLGLILRAEIIWSKPNGLPESVQDRVRRSHEQWFHFTKSPRYFSSVDEIRENYAASSAQRYTNGFSQTKWSAETGKAYTADALEANPLGKLPGSVWTIPAQPLQVPPELGVDHFAAYPMEWPRRIIQGWTPNGICTVCGEGRRPTVQRDYTDKNQRGQVKYANGGGDGFTAATGWTSMPDKQLSATITGYTCNCPTPTAPTTPAVVLDPFGGTGTTALVAKALGRTGITVDLSADYCRLAEWRVNDLGQLATALQMEKPEPVPADQLELFT